MFLFYLFFKFGTGSGVSSLGHFDGSMLEQGVMNILRHVQDLSMSVPEGRYNETFLYCSSPHFSYLINYVFLIKRKY